MKGISIFVTITSLFLIQVNKESDHRGQITNAGYEINFESEAKANVLKSQAIQKDRIVRNQRLPSNQENNAVERQADRDRYRNRLSRPANEAANEPNQVTHYDYNFY